MHEFSLCKSLLKEACNAAENQLRSESFDVPSEHSSAPFTVVIFAISVQISLFSGVDKQLLKRAFNVAIHDFHCYSTQNTNTTPFSLSDGISFSPHAQLHIKEAPAAIFCEECDRQYSVNQQQFSKHYLSCRKNTNHHTRLLSGEEMLLTNIQIQKQAPPVDFSSVSKSNQEGNTHV